MGQVAARETATTDTGGDKGLGEGGGGRGAPGGSQGGGVILDLDCRAVLGKFGTRGIRSGLEHSGYAGHRHHSGPRRTRGKGWGGTNRLEESHRRLPHILLGSYSGGVKDEGWRKGRWCQQRSLDVFGWVKRGEIVEM
jgi:hypothetical protein